MITAIRQYGRVYDLEFGNNSIWKPAAKEGLIADAFKESFMTKLKELNVSSLEGVTYVAENTWEPSGAIEIQYTYIHAVIKTKEGFRLFEIEDSKWVEINVHASVWDALVSRVEEELGFSLR
jgi:hypothetical protein